jgi:RNA polymerase sigma-32 factor
MPEGTPEMTQTLPIPISLRPDRGLSAYIRAINALPILSADEERRLAVRYRRHDDLDAARTLVLSHLRQVVRIARGFAGYGLPQADLIQEGNIGLMKAVKHFDPQRGVRLISFAVHWIKAEIYDYILRNWRIVKVATTKSQRKLFFNLRKSRERLGWMTRGEKDALAADLNVAPETVDEMEGRLTSPDVSFDGATDADDEEFVAAPAGYLPDMRYNPEVLVTQSDHESNRSEQLATALARLDPRSREIIERRWLAEDKLTLHQLAAKYGVSAERIRQIEARALEQMKDTLAA